MGVVAPEKKINIIGIIRTALGHANLKCPQISMKLNINEQCVGA